MDQNVFNWKPYLIFASICGGFGLTLIAGAKLFGLI
jgi:hypothetical protein